MECHDAQQLLAFVNRPSEELDAAERDALRDHVANCPDCSARLQADRRADEVFGPLMRNIAVPADLKEKVLQRLSAERPRPWKPWVAAAAAVLLLVATLAWALRPLPEFTIYDLDYIRKVDQLDEDAIEDRFEKQGVTAKVPRDLDYTYLQHVHIVEVKGRRVAKLSFSRPEKGANAEVLVLSNEQFRTSELRENGQIGGTTSIRIWHEKDSPNFVYVAFFRGNINLLMRQSF
jgi:Putative zinc-finger